jgi:hypothetical protein
LRDFSAVTVRALPTGSTLSVDSARTFSSTDAVGNWGIFARLTDELGVAHDSPEVTLAVGGRDDSTLVPTAPPRVAAAWLSPPGNLHVEASYQNQGSAVQLQQLVLTSRPPGGANGTGPFDDLSPRLGATTIGPGQTIDPTGDRSFIASDDPCSGMLCVVSAGQCSFSSAP